MSAATRVRRRRPGGEFPPAVLIAEQIVDELQCVLLGRWIPRPGAAVCAAFPSLDCIPVALGAQVDVTARDAAPPAVPPVPEVAARHADIVHTFDTRCEVRPV